MVELFHILMLLNHVIWAFSQDINEVILAGISETPPVPPSMRADDDDPPEFMVLDHSLPQALSQALEAVYNGNEH